MEIVIIGLGKIGKIILSNLVHEKHTITIIDENKDKIEALIEKYDVLGVVGNGACMDVQKEANVKNADLVIALTGSDELNILACLVAKKLGVKNTISRVKNPDYRKQILDMKEELGVSMILNPERETAKEILSLINLPSVAQIESFARGRVNLVAIVIEKGSMLIGESLSSISRKINTKVLICAVQRGGNVYIPSGNFVLQEGDKIHFTSDAGSLASFLEEINLIKKPLKRIMIVGGGETGYYLAQSLSKENYKIKLIEINESRAEKLANDLPKVTVVMGDGTKHDLLMEEGIESIDAFVTLIDIDEENIIASMFAKKKDVRRIITKIDREEIIYMQDEFGIDNIVSPKDIIAGKVLRYIRALANRRGSDVVTLHLLVNNQVEALEFVAKGPKNIYGKPLKELKLKDNCLIACITRDDKVIIPDGNTSIHQNDNIVVVTTHKNFDDLTDVFA